MADGSAATPGSSTGKQPAFKDKSCPYCHQQFTSSSLGRHLDLYIKPKNAKPPDDIHNVEEIRQLRGNVTRRQARSSTGKREGSTPSSSKPTPLPEQGSPSATGGYATAPGHVDDRIRTFLNKATWHQTGVINDLPTVGESTPFVRRASPSRRASAKEEIMHRQGAMEERDRARATELALQEVLDSVKAANMRAHPTSPFDFNFFSLSFPQLCLLCLSASPSLLEGSVVPDRPTWSTEAPQAVHLDTLNTLLESRLREWRQQRQSYHGHSNGANGYEQSQMDNEPWNETEENYFQHTAEAFEQWRVIPEKQKQERWREECAKAFAREQEKHQETKRRLDIAEQEVLQLRAQLASSHQSPAYPPAVLPINRETAANLMESRAWDINSLISRHKAQIQANRSVQHALPTPSSWAAPTPPNMSSHQPNGDSSYSLYNRGDQHHYHNNNNHNGRANDEDLADAPGDEDDVGNSNQPMDKGMLDPNLRDGDGNGEADGEGHLGGRMLMGLREYDQANAGVDGGGIDMEH